MAYRRAEDLVLASAPRGQPGGIHTIGPYGIATGAIATRGIGARVTGT